ncbi:MAG: Lon protease [Fimbriimonadales bacterium]|nr:MAG: Lon protease [Fimbriimonadales bacterium]
MSDIELKVREEEQKDGEQEFPDIPAELNILPLRDSVVYPMLIAPLSVGRPSSVQLIDDTVAANNRIIGVVAQKDPSVEVPTPDDVYPFGCAVIIRTLVKMPDGIRLIVQGVSRIRLTKILQTQPYLRASIEVVEEEPIKESDRDEIEALRRTIASLFERCINLSPQLPDELRTLTQAVQEPNVMADLVAAHMTFSVADKQRILEAVPVKERMRTLVELLNREVRVLELTSKVQSEVNEELTKSQRDYYLREQLKAIQKELGEEDDREQEIEELRQQIEAAGMPQEALKEATRELQRLARMSPASPEYNVVRTYLDYMVSMPWNVSTEDTLDLKKVRKVLDRDHYGLDKIKERIVEFLAVRKFKKEGVVRQPILCFLGPPGVGKTSLGRSIASALGRKFVRVSLGGMRDEAEIKGHRRTYIGAMPGQIIQNIRRCGSNNPVFILDEIDKLGADFRGDPSSALLEVLDPEQNSAFRDHYLDAPFDLSKVFFITTANVIETIPPPLRDRMEVIELGGYTEAEKIEIARRHIIPKQLEEHGLTSKKLKWTKPAIRMVISSYTREAGVRNLEREIAAITRKAVTAFAEGRRAPITVTPEYVQSCLGAPRYLHDEVAERELRPGLSVGMVWTPVGGDIVFVESAKLPGKGDLILTGQLGDVMKESARIALSYLETLCDAVGVQPDEFGNHDVHVHVPAGAIPKDGPSAGITILISLASLFTGKTIKKRLAMTGELTLTGQVLPVGGIKEKVIAAHRAGVKEVILPAENEKDYKEEVPEKVRKSLKVHFVRDAGEVCRIALGLDCGEARPKKKRR